MKISDIKSGNIVRVKNRTDFYAIVADIYANGVVNLTRKFVDGYSDRKMVNVENLEPILLNERIIVELGFRLTNMINGIMHFGLRCGDLYLESGSWNSCATIDGDFRTIETLHDIQNFWHTQTKQELNVEKLIL